MYHLTPGLLYTGKSVTTRVFKGGWGTHRHGGISSGLRLLTFPEFACVFVPWKRRIPWRLPMFPSPLVAVAVVAKLHMGEASRRVMDN